MGEAGGEKAGTSKPNGIQLLLVAERFQNWLNRPGPNRLVPGPKKSSRRGPAALGNEKNGGVYLNSVSALRNVCETPQARGRPTKSQAMTAEPPDDESGALELGTCGFIREGTER